MRGTVGWLVLGVLSLGGCWAGRQVPRTEPAYAHPAVRWVYRTGGQIGNQFILIAPIRNTVWDLYPGNRCVTHLRPELNARTAAAASQPVPTVRCKSCLEARPAPPR